ncbi:hypothetical protein [Streptomyces carpaticus]|uniref:YncE family protein n=1 Tax=Streptomyces carpaticus TaxID=285558 RepID=UPI0031F82F1D
MGEADLWAGELESVFACVAGRFSRVGLELNVEIHQVPVGRDPRHMGITSDGRTAYICVWDAGHVSKLDHTPLTEHGDVAGITEAAQIPVAASAHPYSLAISPCGSRVFVALPSPVSVLCQGEGPPVSAARASSECAAVSGEVAGRRRG